MNTHQVPSEVSFSASDFFLLSAMSYDRYVAICRPLRYPAIMRRGTVRLILVLAWLVPACEMAISVALVAMSKGLGFPHVVRETVPQANGTVALTT
ncbi:Olfactory receptor 1J4 [Liparis tanakae]|uniref:Olfactory receptor 1J4 n=1 Tax=Liparis tanakae TaxID=230148 RepID=A0A4Z2EWQ2_9TELE|nr:Olfactory receptor 1J4 [Liparis tanakae]